MNELDHKINMKLVNIFVPREEKNVYAIHEFEMIHLYKSRRVRPVSLNEVFIPNVGS